MYQATHVCESAKSVFIRPLWDDYDHFLNHFAKVSNRPSSSQWWYMHKYVNKPNLASCLYTAHFYQFFHTVNSKILRRGKAGYTRLKPSLVPSLSAPQIFHTVSDKNLRRGKAGNEAS